MPQYINGEDLERMMEQADNDGGREYLSSRGFDILSIAEKAQSLAIALFEEVPNPHQCAAAAYLVGLESGLRAVEEFRGVSVAP